MNFLPYRQALERKGFIPHHNAPFPDICLEMYAPGENEDELVLEYGQGELLLTVGPLEEIQSFPKGTSPEVIATEAYRRTRVHILELLAREASQ